MTDNVPEQRKSNNAKRCQLDDVAERWRLHGRVRTAFAAYNVTC